MRALAILIPLQLLFLSGCALIGELSDGRYYRADGFMKDPRTASPTEVDLDALCFAEDIDINTKKCAKTAYAKAAVSKADRNRLQDYLMGASNTACVVHASSVLNTSTNIDLLTGLTALGLGAAAPLIKPLTTKNAFAAGAAAATGSQSLAQRAVYKDMLVTSIIQAIRDGRESQAAIIASKRSRALEDYSVDAAIFDVLEYHDRCSFYSALADLSQAIEKKATCSNVDAKRETLLQRLAAAATEEAKKSYRDELTAIDKQIAECH